MLLRKSKEDTIKNKSMTKSIDMDQLKHLYYRQKKSAFEVAEIFGCSPAVIYGRMKKHGMQCRSYSESQKIRYAQVGLNLDITEIVHLYFQERLTLVEVGIRLGVSSCSIRRRLIAAGYQMRKRGASRYPYQSSGSRFTDADFTEMERLYCQAEWSSAEIASRYNCSGLTVREHLKRRGVRLRTTQEAQALRRKKETERNSDSRRLPPEQVTPERILQLRNEEHLTIDAIAGRCSLSNLEVYNILQEMGGI